MGTGSCVLGVDIGSVTASLAVVDRERRVLGHAYGFHQGRIAETVLDLLQELDLAGIGWAAATTSCPGFLACSRSYDNRLALIAAAKARHPALGSILNI